MNRREARKQAFLLLFQYKFQKDDIDEILEAFLNESKAGNQADYIKSVVLDTKNNIQRIDGIIGEYSTDWSVERLSSVSLAVLRLAVCEMLFAEDIPSAVSVSEAVAIAKEFEGDEAAPFINGILGRIKEDADNKIIDK